MADAGQAHTGGPEDPDKAAEVFTAARPRLFGIAYRMLGSATEAEDVLQEVWLRWQTYDRASVTTPVAFLTTATTRLAINVLQSARVRRETYVGPWLPEPVATGGDPFLGAERAEALGLAVLMLLERLSPTERAAFILREAFEYPYPQIADIVQVNDTAARKLVSRARRHLWSERRAPVSDAEHRELLTAFVAAARIGDLAALEKLLAADVVSYSDGGGGHRAARLPVVGSARVAYFTASIATRAWPGVTVDWGEINGERAALLRDDGRLIAVLAVSASAEGIDQVLWMVNPVKIAAASADLADRLTWGGSQRDRVPGHSGERRRTTCA
ncbi:RNA polymerase sigma-70 factor (ECF subfamily) [Actinocorallia herbida]|uniref:RNA polymerase sigma-70 factor (ECF subfamily) n=1 Tax=Actinocorallia herbida TaxID=58109 RepID=A0A3N1CXC7_9ACTN|nr:RNA polymerase sigma-70 factor [Actinocorallia herbida]ROO85378.1 RNA polymerase sigma-70 factor (ECF subfamily) [Actinocorallia herbida]